MAANTALPSLPVGDSGVGTGAAEGADAATGAAAGGLGTAYLPLPSFGAYLPPGLPPSWCLLRLVVFLLPLIYIRFR